MVWAVDMSMRPVYISSSVRHYLGYTSEEAMNVRMEDVFAPHSFKLAMELLAEETAEDRRLAEDGDIIRLLEVDLVHKDGHLIPFEVCYSGIRNACGEVTEVMAVARSIGERRKAQDESRASTEKLLLALEQTVRALAALCGTRDPYTAGHQRRVADLSCTIAAKLGLEQDTITGLRLAGLIHDIGKVRIPVEILVSTRHLSAAEFEIIKAHPTTGYEVLSGIDFPWAVAETVYQHHERLDGSGYPRGLAGEEIMVESRILGVADVVEAIASDRPYRKTLGIGAAMDEIARHRGKLFDSSVVDACLEVFRKDGYTLEQQPLLSPSEDN